MPRTFQGSPSQPVSKTVTTEDSVKIAFDHYQRGHSRVIVLAHGFYNSKNAVLFKQMSEALADEYDVLTMDFRGHGNSGGLCSFSAKEYLDLSAVLNYAKNHYERIGVVGFSLGAATSIITATKSDAMNSLICVSPPSQFGKIEFNIFKMGFGENVIYNIFQEGRIGKGCRPGNLWQKKIKPIDVIDQVRIPILFIAGKKDWLVYPWHTQALFDKKTGEKELNIFDQATHAEYIFRRFPDKCIQTFKNWFKHTLKNH